MSGAIASAILGFISKPLDTVLDKLLVDKDQKEKFKHEIELETLKAGEEQGMALENRLLAEIHHPNWLRDSVRPVITYASYSLYAGIKAVTIYVITRVYYPLLMNMLKGTPEEVYGRLDKIKALLREYTQTTFTAFDFYLLLTIFGFWFGSKLIERFVEKTARTGGIKGLIMG